RVLFGPTRLRAPDERGARVRRREAGQPPAPAVGAEELGGPSDGRRHAARPRRLEPHALPPGRPPPPDGAPRRSPGDVPQPGRRGGRGAAGPARGPVRQLRRAGPARRPLSGPASARPTLRTVAREWGRIGCIGFGGPPAHIALLRDLCVERRGWLSAHE